MAKPIKTRNSNTMTESAYFSMIRSTLRRGFRYWKPIQDTLKQARRISQSDNKRLKWEFQCNSCKEWHPQSNVQVDHEVPCGSLRCYEDIVPFIINLSTESGFQVLCKPCHQTKTNSERKKADTVSLA